MGKGVQVIGRRDHWIFVDKATGERWTAPRATDGQGEATGTYIVDSLAGGRVVWGCRRCNWTHENDGEPVEHVCGSSTVTRLGDRVETALTAVGVTKERWQALKSSLGLPPGCNCRGRKEWMNKLDEALQLGERLSAVQKSLGWKD